ncbi:MAG: delta-60 repeat domain-containing protein, partial [Pirellulaceae bacterium]
DKVLTVSVTNTNDAPVLNASASPSMGLVLEGATNPSGVTVAALVVDGSITDQDGTAVKAIAITGLNTSLGTWQYSLDGGTNWLTINAELINSSTNELTLLLGPTAQLRLIPFGDLSGSVSDAITFRAWDQTSGSEGQYAIISSTGGTCAFSSATDTASITVTAINDSPTFLSGDGIVMTLIGTGADQGLSVAVQPDGKVLVGGYARIGTTDDFALVRYNADGSLDSSFGTGGMVTTAIGTGTDWAQSLTIQPDGKIVVGGYSLIGGNWDFALVRYNANGTLDTSFGTGGMVMTAFGTSADQGYSVTIQPDGKIVVGGYASIGSNNDFALVRYNADGTLDTSFGIGGMVTTAIVTGTDQGRSVTIQPDGKLVVAGWASNGSNNDFALVRYNANGTLDTSFGTGGKVTTPVGTSTDTGLSVTIQPDGKIVVAGYVTFGFSNIDFALVRYNADGSRDTTFGTGGKVTTAVGTGYDVGLS